MSDVYTTSAATADLLPKSAESYNQLVILRGMTGASLGAAIPITTSMFGDRWDTVGKGTAY